MSIIKKHLNLILLLVIAACAALIFNKLKDEGHIKTYTTCVSSAKIVVNNDSGNLKAIHYVSRCNDSAKLQNNIYIEESSGASRDLVYQGYSEQPANLYLFWDEYDGLYVSGTESDVITSAKRHFSQYRVEYLPLRQLRVALGEAYSKYKNMQLAN
ncbi:hypothetical protein [Kangiella sp.]|uniref:hypothetical protein n=1 Tax=Kangiella sp. TaxID=1920245 RepID=UPI00199CFD3A|nr:hypothetical protein [Kangiella sp.]MBD3652704.1 hypothetical protein [Kangiella sp.]